jgi:acyl carrier protein
MELQKFITDFELLFDEVESNSLTAETNFRNIEEWSSLMALALIAMIDDNYDKKITSGQIKNSTTIEDLFNCLF